VSSAYINYVTTVVLEQIRLTFSWRHTTHKQDTQTCYIAAVTLTFTP